MPRRSLYVQNGIVSLCVCYSLLVLFAVQVRLSSILTYPLAAMCNTSIDLGRYTKFAGLIDYSSTNSGELLPPFLCEMLFSTDSKSLISVQLVGAISNIKQVDVCLNSQFAISSVVCVSKPDDELIIISHRATLVIKSNQTSSIHFKLIFSTFHMGDCSQTEFKCNDGRCIDRSVTCVRPYNICSDDTDVCPDLNPDRNPDRNQDADDAKPYPVANVVFTVFGILVIVLLITVYCCKSNLRLSRIKQCFSSSQHRLEANTGTDTSRGIQLVRLSSTVLETNDEAFDRRNFDPPPRYNSVIAMAQPVEEDAVPNAERLPPTYSVATGMSQAGGDGEAFDEESHGIHRYADHSRFTQRRDNEDVEQIPLDISINDTVSHSATELHREIPNDSQPPLEHELHEHTSQIERQHSTGLPPFYLDVICHQEEYNVNATTEDRNLYLTYI